MLEPPRNASEPEGGTASLVCEPSPDETSRVRWVHLPPGEDVGAALNETVMVTNEVVVSTLFSLAHSTISTVVCPPHGARARLRAHKLKTNQPTKPRLKIVA